MSVPAWFDTNFYLEQKLAQCQAAEPNAGWDMLKLLEAFNNAGFNPFTPEGIYAHFEAFGHAEAVSPNPYFNVDYYMQSKLALMQQDDPDYTMEQLEKAFSDAGLSAWDHFNLYGLSEGVDPSEYFDTSAYMDAKLAEMQKTDPNYTMDQLCDAFKNAGLNPIEHYTLFGKNENLDYTPYPLPEEVDPNKAIVELGEDGKVAKVNGEAASALPEGEYSLVGSVVGLTKAPYSTINGANGDITLKDTAANLFSNGVLTDDAKEILGLASKVEVSGSLSELFGLPEEVTSKASVTYTLTKVDSIALENATVAEVTNASTAVAAFLSNPYVKAADGVTKPEADAVKITVTSIEDNVANLAAADLDNIDCNTITVKDTAANVDGMSAALRAELGSKTDSGELTIAVEDSAANILGMKAAAFATNFNATDTQDVSLTIDSKVNTSGYTNAITFTELKDNSTIDLTLVADKGADTGVTLDANTVFKVGEGITGVTFDITGTTLADTITANDNGGIINGNGGADAITLGTGAVKDTIELTATKFGTDVVTVTNFHVDEDKIDVSNNSVLSSFDFTDEGSATFEAKQSVFGSTVEAWDGKVFIASGSFATANASASIAWLFSGELNANVGDSCLIIASTNNSSGDTYVWYVENTSGTTIDNTEVHTVAVLKGVTADQLDIADFINV